MTRIAENQISRALVGQVLKNRLDVNQYSNEVSSGIKVNTPGDTNLAGSISQLRESITRADGYKDNISSVRSLLEYQDEVMKQANELLIRAKEVAAQGANETNGPEIRRQMAEEIFQIRDHMVTLANSQYQGKYIFGYVNDDRPPFLTTVGTQYTLPTTGPGHDHYIFNPSNTTSTLGAANLARSVKLTDDLTVETNRPGDALFQTSIHGLERLGRALQGYTTLPAYTPPAAAPVPTGGGVAYIQPNEFHNQTTDIANTIELLDGARNSTIQVERVTIAGKLRRLETADSVLDVSKSNAQDVLGRIQNADEIESASNLQIAQNALEASLTTTARILKLSVLDYI